MEIPLIHNAESIPLRDIPCFSRDDFLIAVMNEKAKGGRVVSFFGSRKDSGGARLYMVMAHDKDGECSVFCSDVKDSYPALTPDCPETHLFEREIAEQCGVTPEGHPWLKPVRFLKPAMPGVTDFFKIEGEEAHEVAVGPVHAGVIEPGHFRFLCHGENVFHLEISLGYQHRGVEKALIGGPGKRTLHYMETLAGDTTIGHAMAYCQALESLSGTNPPARAHAVRGIALELERLANHTGDLGALSGDVAYLPTSSFCGRLRGDFLNMTALITGNRFGRGLLIPGGAAFDLDAGMVKELITQLDRTYRDVKGAVELLWNTTSVVERFEETGVLPPGEAEMLGVVGVAARASGIERDVRFDFPSGMYQFTQIPVSTYSSGDVFARAYVRWLEIQRSEAFIRATLEALPAGNTGSWENNYSPMQIQPETLTLSMTEGWRGEICHVAITDNKGKFRTYKVVDPSFHNWAGLAMVLRGEQISNFPLCNKSFNLSYCGHDL